MKKKKEYPSIRKLIPIESYDKENGYFLCEDGMIIDFIKIMPKDIYNLDEEERRLDNYYFEKFYKLVSSDIKLWAMNFPEDTTEQQNYFNYKKERCKNPIFKEILETSLMEVTYLQENFLTREFYMQVFADSQEEYKKIIDTIQSVLGLDHKALADRISAKKKKEILFKINNKNSRIPEFEENISGKELIKMIQPQGGIYFGEDYVLTGTGYETCIHVYAFKDILDENWMMKLCRIDNTVATVDLFTLDKGEVKININKSIDEQESRKEHANNYSEYYDADERKKELAQLYAEVSSMGEVVKLLQIRIFVYEGTKEKLERSVEKIINEIDTDDYKGAVFINEMENEWKSQYLPYKKQIDKLSFEGNPFKSEAIAGGNPFHSSEIRDKNGDYMGATPSGGSVLFDEFSKSETRLQYHSVAIGIMRSGKSTYLKKRFKFNAARGNHIRCFDVTGEFKKMTTEYGGKILNFDGSQGVSNWLEIRYVNVNEHVNYARHISKVLSMYRTMNSDIKKEEINHFHEVLDLLYEKFNLKPGMQPMITRLSPESYPTLSDLINLVSNEIEVMKEKNDYSHAEEVLIANKILNYNSILKQLNTLKNAFGKIFDGITSIDNLTEEQIVTYDLSNIKELDPDIFTAVLINILSLSWDDCVTNGSLMKESWENGNTTWEDVIRFLIIIDESHRWVNTSKPEVLQLIDIFMREAPKFFGGILLASQSIRDYFPSLDGSGNGNIDPRVMNQMKNIFELAQYKIIFHQEHSTIPLIDKAFGNILTVSQKNRIPFLGQGECILCISNEHNIEYKVFLTENERVLFSGGA